MKFTPLAQEFQDTLDGVRWAFGLRVRQLDLDKPRDGRVVEEAEEQE
jgi:hypothetical protein